MRCWGYSYGGILGYANADHVHGDQLTITPAEAGDVQIGGTATWISVGTSTTCVGLAEGGVRCWGGAWMPIPRSGVVGDDEYPADVPVAPLGDDVTHVAPSNVVGCTMHGNGDVRCWGGNSDAALGLVSAEQAATLGENPPLDLGGLATRLDAAEYGACALLQDQTLRCWGDGYNAPLGYGLGNESIGDDETPASAGPLPIGGAVVAISFGPAHACAILDTLAIRCWGDSSYAPLGYGTYDSVGFDNTPADVGDVPIWD